MHIQHMHRLKSQDRKKEKYPEWLMYWYVVGVVGDTRERESGSVVPLLFYIERTHFLFFVFCILYRAVISCFTAFEVFGDMICGFRFAANKNCIHYVLSVSSKAAVTFYRKYLHPTLENYEGKIDQVLMRQQEKSTRNCACCETWDQGTSFAFRDVAAYRTKGSRIHRDPRCEGGRRRGREEEVETHTDTEK